MSDLDLGAIRPQRHPDELVELVAEGYPRPGDDPRGCAIRLLDALAAAGRLVPEATLSHLCRPLYAPDGEPRCNSPHPSGGGPCARPHGHAVHLRPAPSGADGWRDSTTPVEVVE